MEKNSKCYKGNNPIRSLGPGGLENHYERKLNLNEAKSRTRNGLSPEEKNLEHPDPKPSSVHSSPRGLHQTKF